MSDAGAPKIPGDQTVDITRSVEPPEPAVLEQPNQQIGPYRLLSQLGEGGFGTVWLAERREPFVQRVALKLIKAGMDSKAVIGRFHQERQAMAAMSHPGIARVLDGGLTETGRPYFVMEYVKGQPITDFCDTRKLSLVQRLALFQRACEAVQHAHLKGVIHRDLKPSNILAFDVEGQEPSVKVIDFGVAKAAHPGAATHTVFTEIGQMIGTLEYMSPEQADSRVAEIDTRSDIYSLGAVLYELLTGLPPFDAEVLRGKGVAEVQRILVNDDPASPSLRVSTIVTRDKPAARRIGDLRGEPPFELIRHLRTELEWIPLMAMRKEPQNRYQSAADLSRDIERYLLHEPLMAGPPSTRYRLGKFIRRRKALAVGIFAVSTSLVVGLSLALWQWREAVTARTLAESRAAEAEAVTRFVTDSLVSSDPLQGGDRDFTVKQAMRQALTKLERGSLAKQPEVQARLQLAIADVLFGNAELDEAIALASRALATQEVVHGVDSIEVTTALSTLGRAYQERGLYADAEAAHRRALAIRRASVPANEMAITRTMVNLANAVDLQGKHAEAEGLLREVIEIRTRLLGPDDPSVAGPTNNLGVIYKVQGRFADAEPLYRGALASREKALGPDHPSTADSLNNLANVLGRLERFPEAESLHRRALAIREKAFGPDHPRVADSLGNLGITIDAQRRFAEAEQHLRRALQILEARLGPTHPDTVEMCRNIATNLRHQQRDAEAAPFEARLPASADPAAPAIVPATAP
jgi:serine/threonine protein kinase/Tfp pilus assembly protein PilF